MPMGVALRIDKALAAEAESRRGGVDLVEAPDWDRLMRDSPWEQPAAEIPEPVRLGVVSDDGTIVPARTRSSRRRRWAMPAVAASAAAAVVVGTLAVSGGLLAGGSGPGGSPGSSTAAQPASPSGSSHQRARAYALTDSNYNYSDRELRQPLLGYFGAAPALEGPTDTARVDRCVDKVAGRSKLKTFAVDQGQYNGQEALIVASWKDQAAKKLRIDIVDPFNCKNLRKPTLGRW
ncbi:hypothetical protein DMB42_33155 [Nonomuraea sp. WAC 01424]|nr:hypothetical protein DMB42_33155 [Nonomuraea sp. WAC 01424]